MHSTAESALHRLNVEVRQLHTSIHDESIFMAKTINELQQLNPLLAQELQRQYRSRAAINTVHIKCLDCIEMRADFSGIRGIGIRCEAGQGGDSPSPLAVDMVDDANSSLAEDLVGNVAEDLSGNNEAIDREEDILFTQMLADYIEEIYN